MSDDTAAVKAAAALQRIGEIAQHIRSAIAPFTAAYDSKTAANQDLQDAAKAETNVREQIMLALADFSHKNNLTNGEIEQAAAKAVSMGNVKAEASLTTFIGEAKRAMRPGARAHAAALVALRDLCWQSEEMAKAGDKETPTPLREAYARKYHMLLAMFGEAEDGNVMVTPHDVAQHAEGVLEDRRLDTKKVRKRLDKIAAELQAFYNDFPVDDIQVCVQTLGEIGERELKLSRGLPVKGAKVTAPAVPVSVPVTTVAVSVAEGAYDPMADMVPPIELEVSELAEAAD